ncbi:MAG: glycosyltransferase family 39 protein [Synechococcales bacterium]|nr:glycosyltransferase family 39 protein [Synechococcales bacterium]
MKHQAMEVSQGVLKRLSHPIPNAVLWILGLGFLLRMAIAVWLPPGFDEAYYYLYTQHPDLSFFDHPPLVAISTAVGLWLSGEQVTPLTIRLGALLLHTATLYLLYLTGKRLFSEAAGRLTLVFATIAPICLVAFGVMTLPDAPLMFFWTATLWGAAEEFFPQRSQPYRPTYRLAILGILIGLACISKYHGFLLGVGLVGFCLTSADHRKALGSPWAWISFALWFLILYPVLYWNAQHDWISFTFQAGRGVPASQFSFDRLFSTWGQTVLYLFPTIGLPLWWVSLRVLIAQLLSPWVQRLRDSHRDLRLKQRLVLWLSAPVFLLFTAIGGYRQVLPTWTLPGLFIALLLLGQKAAVWQQRSPKTVQRWWQGSAIVITSLLLMALSHVAFGTLQRPSQTALLGGLIPIQQDASIQLVDIQQLRDRVSQSPSLMQTLKQSDFVFSNRFHLAGHIAMALTPLHPTPVTCFDKRDMRGFSYWSQATDWLGKDGLYLTSQQFQTREDSAAEYRPYFKTFTKLAELPLYRGGVEVDRFHVYLGQQMLQPFPRPIEGSRGA